MKRIQFTLLSLITLLSVNNAKSQCNYTGFTVTSPVSPCPNDGVINVQIPGAVTCSGWNAIIIMPDSTETVQAIPPNGGPVSFTGLDTGNYQVFLFNTIASATRLPYSGNPINVSTSYNPIIISSTETKPTCYNAASGYTPDGEVTINISGGVGPYRYRVIGSVSGAQLSPSTANTTYTFGNMEGAESYAITVFDLACTNLSFSRLKEMPQDNGLNLTVSRQTYERVNCNSDCNSLSSYFRITGKTSNRGSSQRTNLLSHPNNMTISVNSAPTVPLVYVRSNDINSFTVQGPDMQVGDNFTIYLNDSCDVYSSNFTVPLIDNSFLKLDSIVNTFDCGVSEFQIGLEYEKEITSGTRYMTTFCEDNNVVIEYESSPSIWDTVLDTNFTTLQSTIPVDSAGNYRVTVSDDCHSVTKTIKTPTLVDINTITVVEGMHSVVEGTASIIVSTTNANLKYPLNIKVEPLGAYTNPVMLNATGPGNIVGTYNINYPFWSGPLERKSAGAEVFLLGDLALGSYIVTTYDACGDSTIDTVALTHPASYNIETEITYNCDSTADITVHYNNTYGANLFATTVGNPSNSNTYILNADYPFNFVTGGSSSSGIGVFNDLPTGNDYLVLLRTALIKAWGSASENSTTGRNFHPSRDPIYFNDSVMQLSSGYQNYAFFDTTIRGVHPFYFPVSIPEYAPIGISHNWLYCDASNRVVYLNVTSGTPIYPLVYSLYRASDSMLMFTDTAFSNTDTNALQQFFYNVPPGVYDAKVTSGWSSTLPDGCVSVGQEIVVTPSYTIPEITNSDTVVCYEQDSINLAFNIPLNLWGLKWMDTAGNVIDSNVNNIWTLTDTSKQIIVEYSLLSGIACFSPPTYRDTFNIHINLPPDTNKQVLGDTVCYENTAWVKVLNTDSGVIYEVFQNGFILLPQAIDTSANDGDTVYLPIVSSLLSIGDNKFEVVARTGDCEYYSVDSVLVYVYDTIAPQFVANDTSIILSCLDELAGVPLLDSAVLDSTGLTSITVTVQITDSTCVNQLTRLATYVATNYCGYTDTLVQTVIVKDSIAPTVICQDTSVYLDSDGQFIIDTSFVFNGVTDSCGVDSIWIKDTDTLLTCANIGVHQVWVYARDLCNNTDSCVANVTVLDTLVPTVLCKDTIIYLNTSGSYTIDTSYVLDSISDNCSLASVSLSKSIFSCTDTGLNTVQIYATDISGNIDSCTANVWVYDTISPTVNCQNITISLDNYGAATIDVSMINNGSSDNCSIDTMYLSQDTFDCSNIGSNSITLTVVDVYGNTDSCTSIVTILDNLSPSIICPSNIYDTVENMCEYIVLDYTDSLLQKMDNCSDSINITVTQMPSPGTVVSIDESNGTIQSVTLTAFDTLGNLSTCNFDLYLYCTPNILIPEFISPNGDDKNDVWYINNIENYENNVKIFNRWGSLVYSKDNYDNTWGGEYKGSYPAMQKSNTLPAGTYYYILEVKNLDTYTGFIQIQK